VQGFGVIQGEGVEMVLTLGTGMGCALYVDGRYVPNIELAHHPFRKGMTYEEYIGNAARKQVGNEKWARRVRRVVDQILPIFNPRVLYLGGGNARRLAGMELPEAVRITQNVAGLLGGIALWR
jgi:polyphosphate glucokinase